MAVIWLVDTYSAMLNSGAIRLAAKYLAANFDWPLYYIANIDDLPLY